MINNISQVDTRPQMSINKAVQSFTHMGMPPILGFKTPVQKEKAEIRIKKIKRSDNIIIPGEIDDNYVDIVEEAVEDYSENIIYNSNFFNTSAFTSTSKKRKLKYLKNSYIIDYIHSPKPRCGMGTNAIKALAEKAKFDPKADGRIVTFSSPLIKESSPAIFFYKLGFRFIDPHANEYIEKCIRDKMPDIPAQTGMMYLPQSRLHKLLRYGELF